MALITRLSRLFTADFHAVLDRIEEPAALLKQAIREMEEELAASEQRIKWLQHERDQLVTREKEVERSLVEIDEQLDVCFQSEKDDLARALIKRQLQGQRLASRLAAKREATEKAVAEQLARFDENQTHLESMRQKAELLIDESAEQPVGYEEDRDWGVRELSVSDEDVEVAFLREKQRRSQS